MEALVETLQQVRDQPRQTLLSSSSYADWGFAEDWAPYTGIHSQLATFSSSYTGNMIPIQTLC